MPHTPAEDLDRITDYISGDLSPEELAETERWIAEDEERRELVRYLRRSRETVKKAKHERVDMERLLRVADRIGESIGPFHAVLEPESTTQTTTKPRNNRQQKKLGRIGTHWLRGWLGSAAALAALGAILFTIPRRTVPNVEVTQIYTTTEHQQAAVILSDSTRVLLMPNTTVRMAHFSTHSRTVVLDRGEAYFVVPRVSTTPFIVRSDEMMVRVLGTEFLVRHNASGAGGRVAVTSGRVGVSLASWRDSVITLTSQQVGVVRDSIVQVNTIGNSAAGVEWKPGQLLFQDTPVPTILQTLSRWYGYQFRYADNTLAHGSVTMVVSTQSSADALAAIERVLAVNVTVVGDTVTLTPRPARSPYGRPNKRTYDMWMPTREVGR